MDTRIIGIVGPRQSGKTTLARLFASDNRPLVSLDSETDRSFALADPVGFIRQFDQAVIDEVQRAPKQRRNLPELAAIDKIGAMPRLILLSALHAGDIVNLGVWS